MNPFKKNSALENEKLLKFPAYISLLAASTDVTMDETKKKAAIKFAHTKTFSCDPLLTEFYKRADDVFEKNIEQLDNDLPKEVNKRDAAINKELMNLNKIVSKLGKEYTSIMQISMKSFTDHVSKAHHNVLVDFIFPIPVSGLSE